tara:strand:+ start:3827 stop:4054 length:228 start_codon:yes stop_codon:yes gene_type:complete
MDIERKIRQLKNDQKKVDKSIDRNKLKFIEEIKNGLGDDIKNGIKKTEPKEIKEEPQTKGLFRNIKQWILNLSKK